MHKNTIISGLLSIFIYGCISCEISAQNELGKQMKVGAYYFAGWSGKSAFDDGTPENAWAKGMPTHISKKLVTEYAGRTPVWGWRDDTEEIMERQIDLAADHGISYFSFCWYWEDNKGPINIEAIENDSKHFPMQMFMKAKNNHRMEFCLLVANHAGSEIIGAQAWKEAADYWLTLFKHPRYMKMDGKPVIVIFAPHGSDKEGLAYMQEIAKKAGFPSVEISCCGNGTPEMGFTSCTDYCLRPGYGQPSSEHPYGEMVEAHVSKWRGTPQQPYIPVATVGWDRRPWESPDGLPWKVEPSWYFTGKTPLAFEQFLLKMRQWMDDNPNRITKDRLAMLYAWNEIGEGGWLVPCKEDPQGEYLKTIKRIVFK
jgi:hypothetical protein